MEWLPAGSGRQPRGKLKAAARAAWDAPPPPTAQELAQAAEWGLPPEALASAAECELLDIWPENWGAVCLFMAAITQWRRGINGEWLGIDYGALAHPERLLRLRGRRARDAFAGLQVMEAEWKRCAAQEAALKAAGAGTG